MKYEFPKDFKWGSAVWAQGTEGAFDQDGKAPTVWDEYYRLAPTRFFDEVGPSETLNWYHDYEKFSTLAEEIGHNSFRTSILWARLLPDGKNVNQKAVDFYRKLFTSFKEKGMELSIVLYWFDMPLLFEDKGGFTNPEVVDNFVYYAETCFTLFDELVDIWYVYNEPIVDVRNKYVLDSCYPNKLDFAFANQTIYAMCIAHAKVVEIFNSKKRIGRIGTVLNISTAYPRSQNSEDLKASNNYDLLHTKCFLDPIFKGVINDEWLSLLKENGIDIIITAADKELIEKNVPEILGLNIYYPARIKCLGYARNPKAPLQFESFYDTYEMPGRQMNSDRGWEIYPKAIYDTLIRLKEDCGNLEIRITENGMGVQNEAQFRDKSGIIQDDYRIEYVKNHLKYAHKAIQDGVNLTGYNMWSFVDLWSPSNQFKNCYGFYEFDLETNEVYPKKSASWFAKITEDNGFGEE
jgi:Beta-glucosidase/6-phospho-beta-glucosidase/beta-galactosidase